MAHKVAIKTNNAPVPLGPYSQAVKVGKTVYLAGQLPREPKSGKLIEGSFTEKTTQVFKNLEAVAIAAGGTMNDIVKMNLFVTDFATFQEVNAVMASFCKEPLPARAFVAVKSLPLNVPIEVDAIMILP